MCHFLVKFQYERKQRAQEMIRWVKVLAAKTNSPGLISRVCAVERDTNSQLVQSSLWLPYAHCGMYVHTHKIKKEGKGKKKGEGVRGRGGRGAEREESPGEPTSPAHFPYLHWRLRKALSPPATAPACAIADTSAQVWEQDTLQGEKCEHMCIYIWIYIYVFILKRDKDHQCHLGFQDQNLTLEWSCSQQYQ